MWAKVDDGYLTNPKIMQLEPAAKLLHLASILYCCRELTDGAFSRQVVPMLAAMAGIEGDITAFVTALLTHNLWSYDGVTYRVHDFLEYNPGAAAIKAKREATKVRQDRWRNNHAQSRDKPAPGLLPDDTPRQTRNGVTNGVSNAVINAAPVPVPVHISTPTDVGVERAPKPKAEPRGRATRLPADWTPDDGCRHWADGKGWPVAFVEYETEKFTNYWHGAGTTKADWSATWRTWLLKAAEGINAPKVTPLYRNGKPPVDGNLTNEQLEAMARGGSAS